MVCVRTLARPSVRVENRQQKNTSTATGARRSNGIFGASAKTLEVRENLRPHWVVPGMVPSRERIAYSTQNPQRHALYAAKRARAQRISRCQGLNPE